METYIQNTQPDVKLYQVPVNDAVHAEPVDFGKGFFDKAYMPKIGSQAWILQGVIIAPIANLTKALGLDITLPTTRRALCR